MVSENLPQDDKTNGVANSPRKRHSRKPEPHCITRVPQNVEHSEEADCVDPLSDLSTKAYGSNNGQPISTENAGEFNGDNTADPLSLGGNHADDKIHGDDSDLNAEFGNESDITEVNKDEGRSSLNMNLTLRDMLEAAGTPSKKDNFFSILQNQQTKVSDVSNGVPNPKEIDSDHSVEEDSSLQIDEGEKCSIVPSDIDSEGGDADRDSENGSSRNISVKEEHVDLADDTSSNTSSKAASITIVRTIPKRFESTVPNSPLNPTSVTISNSPLLAASLSKPTASPLSTLSISVVPSYKGIPYSKRPLEYDEESSGPPGRPKRLRLDESGTSTDNLLGLTPVDYSNLTVDDLPNTVEDIDKQMQILRKELKNLDNLAKEKEREWNHVIDIKKQKELLYMKFRRKKDLLIIHGRNDAHQAQEMKKYQEGLSLENTDPLHSRVVKATQSAGTTQTVSNSQQSVMFTIPVVSQHALGQVTVSKPISLASATSPKFLSELISQTKVSNIGRHGSQIDVQSLIKKHKTTENPPGSLTGSTRPTLSKPSSAQAVSLQDSIVRNLLFPHADKPVVNVQSLIAEHRAKNPEVTDTPRSRYRRRWKPPGSEDGSSQPLTGQGSPDSRDSEDVECNTSRYNSESKEGSQDGGNSSRSSTPRSGVQPPSRLSLNDPNVSYKDVLVQLSKFHEESSGKPSSGSKLMSILQGTSNSSEENNWQSQFSLASLLTGSKTGEQTNNAPTLTTLLDGGKATNEVKAPPRNDSQLNQLFADNIKRMFAEEQDKEKEEPPRTAKVEAKCNNCKLKSAEFVCAGCSKQRYCSRECQIEDWEVHSDECSSVD